MLSLDGTFLVIFVSFVIFMFLMNGLFFNPILNIKTERDNAIEEGRKASEEAASKVAGLTRECEQKLAEARQKAQQMIQEKREGAKSKANSHVSSARQQALTEVEQKSAALQSTREDIYRSLQPEKDALAQSIIEKLSGRQASKAGASS